MKLLTSIFLGMAISTSALATTEISPGEGKIKTVCKTKETKDGKSIQECKKIKVRKKLTGTNIPQEKK